jgi:hypothetical protein
MIQRETRPGAGDHALRASAPSGTAGATDPTRSAKRPRRSSVLGTIIVSVGLLASSAGNTYADDDHHVTPIATDRVAHTPELMGRATPAGFHDIGPAMGMASAASTYDADVHDLDDDGWMDLLISHHGHPAELFMNHHRGDEPHGLVSTATFVDSIHQRPDRHGCAIADVNLDGLDDVFCAKGARSGTAQKWNELWIQGPAHTWSDAAASFGVEDVWGRGRFPAFIDLNHDAYPDLFIGNDMPRQDERRTPNRTYINVQGQRFEQVRMGVTREIGDTCTVTADLDDDGRMDLLICGRRQLFVFRRSKHEFRDVRERVGLPIVRSTAAAFGDLDSDGDLDLVTSTVHRLQVRLQRRDHTFGPVAARTTLQHGHGLALGDPDGDRDLDIFVVEGCVAAENQPDWLLVNDGTGRRFDLRSAERIDSGCGDTAVAIDVDRDGMDEFVVLNGGGKDQPLDLDGPTQVLTLGTWRP